jgi:TP901 family phage tail tape measure protein
MASIEKTVAIVFAGDDKVSKTISKIGSSLDALDAGVKDIADPFAKLSEGVLALDAALAVLAAGGLTYAFIKSKDFESASIELEKVIGDEVGQLDAAKESALELSAAYGESSSEILRSTANFKQAGFDVQAAMQLTRDSLDLVIAGDIEAAEASELLVSALKGFKAPADDASKIVDILNEVSNNYATSVRELGLGMAELSPIANQMGFSFEETAGVLTPVIEVFRSGNESAVALKTGLLRLISDTAPVQEALAAIGVAQKDSNGVLRSGRDILFDVAEAFTTLDEDMKLFITSELVGIRQSARMVEVFDQLGKSTEVTEVALNAAGSAAEEVAIRLASAEVVVNRFKTGFENLGIIVGDQFRGAAVGAIEGGIAIEAAIEDLVREGAFTPVFDRINVFSDRLRDLLVGIAEAMPEAFEDVDFSGLLAALDELGGEFANLFNVDLTDPEQLSNVIQSVIDTLESLTRVTAGMVDFFEPIFDAIVEAIDRFNDLDNEAQKAFGNLLVAAQLVVEAGIYVATAILAIKESGADIENVFDVVIGSIRFIWNSAQVLFDSIVISFTSIVEAILAIADVMTFGFSDSLKVARSAVNDLNNAVKEHQIDQIAEAMEGAGQAAAGMAGETYKTKEGFDELDKTIEGATDDLIDWSQVEAVKDIVVIPKADDDAAVAARDKIDEVLSTPAPQVPITPLVDEDKLKEVHKTVQQGLEWSARVDIAEIEAAAQTTTAVFEGVTDTITSSTTAIATLFGLIPEAGGPIEQFHIEEQIRNEERRQEERHRMQMELAEIELRLAEARLEALQEDGEAIINVSADGLKPHLEAIMFEVLEAVQVRANESQAEFLLGVG